MTCQVHQCIAEAKFVLEVFAVPKHVKNVKSVLYRAQ